ncbi:MAG: cysteine--tRNA ligase [Deltaproteobacteria bacterium]|nr:cysteine--tRNA ligase [Deltaproteobacteria bacterium]
MSIKLYNTLTKKKEAFEPLIEGRVSIYVCGITAYDVCHVGHARSAVVFDIITRYFKYRGYHVTYVKNFTDVDDKIIIKANSDGKTISEISDRYIREHDEDMDTLRIARPTFAPRATEHIDGMINLIRILFDKGLAYEVDGDVYYAVEKFKGYGKLSGRSLEDMSAGARVDVSEKKRNPLDFALWKGSKEGEPWWESPWGRGRPGWHIECSVMSQHFLGETFDIHGGGEDLIFPHHENEIAQSEGATGKPLANYWIYNGFVKVSSEKMSKSLGNFFTVKDILQNYHPEVLRLFMLQSHYKSPVDFSDESLAEARMGMDRFYATLKAIKEVLAGCGSFSGITIENLSGKDRDIVDRLISLPDKFKDAMDDDFNTPRTIGYIFDIVRLVNGYMADEKLPVSAETCFALYTAKRVITATGGVLGLFFDDPDDYFTQDRDREARKQGLDVNEIDRLIEERRTARLAKDWKRADEIRRALAEKKIILQDTPAGTTWKSE